VPVRGVRGSPLGRRHGVAAAVIAASGAANDGRVRARRVHAAMRAHAPATGTYGRSRGLQRKRSKHARERKQQQKSCGQALHVSEVDRTLGDARIKQRGAAPQANPS